MTGEELFQKLKAMTPKQRKFEVVTKAHDVGKWRETICTSITSIEFTNADSEGIEQEDEEPNCIVIE